MDDNGIIRESDLIQLDGTIDRLIRKLEELNSSYSLTIEAIKSGARDAAKAMQSLSGATSDGRKAIDDSAAAADRLEKAYRELAASMSETAKEVADLKAQTSANSKATAEQQKRINSAITSYGKYASGIKELSSQFRALTADEQKNADVVGAILKELHELQSAVAAIGAQLKPLVQELANVSKSEQELVHWTGEESKKLLEMSTRINKAVSGRKQEKAATDPLVKAKKALANAESEEGRKLAELNVKKDYAVRLNRLMAQEQAAEVGSYAQVTATYSRAKLELSQLNQELPENAQRVAELTRELNTAHAAMNNFQEKTGVFSMNVGNYKKAFTGVGYAVQQVVRELPSAAISLNNLFLAVSNNIPVLIDVIGQERREFKAAKEEIEKSNISLDEQKKKIKALDRPIKGIIKSLISWQSGIVLLLSLFSMFGDEIFKWASRVTRSADAAKVLSRSLRGIRREVRKNDSDFGDNMVTIKKLTEEYKDLNTEAEKQDWIKEHESDWQKLNIAIYDVADAEEFFIKNTKNVKEAFVQRARASAAFKLAEEKYKEALPDLVKIEEKRAEVYDDSKNYSRSLKASTLKSILEDLPLSEAKQLGVDEAKYNRWLELAQGGGMTNIEVSPEMAKRIDIGVLQNNIKILETETEKLLELGIAFNDMAEDEVGVYEAVDENGKKSIRTLKDLTDYIARTRLKVTTDSNNAEAKLQQSEFERRRMEAKKQYEAETGDLQNTIDKNNRILSGAVKGARPTEAQRAELEKINADAEQAIEKYAAARDKTLNDIALDEKIAAKKRYAELLQLQIDSTKQGSEEEHSLRLKLIDEQRKIELLENEKLVESERQDINAINAKYNKMAEDAEHEHQMLLLETVQKGVELRLKGVQKGSQQELGLILEQIELERKAAIKANADLAVELRQSEDEINRAYAKRAAFAQGQFEMDKFRADQTATRVAAMDVMRGEGEVGKRAGAGLLMRTQIEWGQEGSRKREIKDLDEEIAALEQEILLYQQGQLDLTDEQYQDKRQQVSEKKQERKQKTGFAGVMGDIAAAGPVGGLLGMLGWNEEEMQAFQGMVDGVIDGINSILEAEIEAAEKEVELAQERVDAAQAAYDAEVEARNNGYANNVATAKAELEAERANQRDREKMLEEAQKKQEAINTVTQTSSLVTAAASTFAAMAPLGVKGYIIAGALIAGMFASFAATKIKAAQVAKQGQEQQYGEGGLEFLDGGSHASGNDIDLNTKNRKGRNMRAEGGEALAIINKRQTHKYRKVLPEIVESLNRGTFEDTFFNAFADRNDISMPVMAGGDIDLSKIEDGVQDIRRQNDTRVYVLPDGATVIQRKNVKRIIRN